MESDQVVNVDAINKESHASNIRRRIQLYIAIDGFVVLVVCVNANDLTRSEMGNCVFLP